MAIEKSDVKVTDVSRVRRTGDIKAVYRASINLQKLYELIRDGDLKYSPRYQRGFEKWAEFNEDALDTLLPVTDDHLQIKNERAIAMAVKFLQGRLYTSHITWNARIDPDGDHRPRYDEENRALSIPGLITVPDTAHRHRAYYWLSHWKRHPEEIPAEVEVDGTVVDRDEIENALDAFEPSDYEVHVDIYTLPPEAEGYLYDEFNADQKAPSTAVAISLNPRKTPSRRFVDDLMKRSTKTNEILAPEEIETRGNVIGAKSRKLTTIATLEAAARNMAPKGTLDKLERDRPDARKDLVEFVNKFFEEWANHFPAFLPGKTYQERWAFRRESYALTNIMFHPLLKLAYELWQDMDANDEDWRHEQRWKDALARLAGKVEVEEEQEDGSTKTVKAPIMAQRNRRWEDLILVPRFDRNGTKVGAVISSTTQTRAAAFSYLKEMAGLQ